MSKLIDIEKVKAKIDLLKRCTMDEHMNYYNQHAAGVYNTLCKIEEFLDTHPEEKQEDLEKEIEECALEMPHGEFTHESECDEHEEWLKEKLRHFYNLGLKYKQEECPKIKGWLTRDKDNELYIHTSKPTYSYKSGLWSSAGALGIGSALFPEITWKNGKSVEVEVELKIKKI